MNDPYYPVGHECPECHETILSLGTVCTKPGDKIDNPTCADHWRGDQDLDVMATRAKLGELSVVDASGGDVIVDLPQVPPMGDEMKALGCTLGVFPGIPGGLVITQPEEHPISMARPDHLQGCDTEHRGCHPACMARLFDEHELMTEKLAEAKEQFVAMADALVPEPEPEVSWKEPAILVEPDDEELNRWVCIAFECRKADHRKCMDERAHTALPTSRRLVEMAFAASVNTVRECARCKEIDEDEEEDIYDTVGRYRRSPRGLATHLVTIEDEDERVQEVVKWMQGQRWTGDDVDIWVALQEQMRLPFPMAVFQFAGAPCVIVDGRLDFGKMQDPNPLMKLSLELRRMEEVDHG